MKVNDENSRIRIQDPDPNPGSGSESGSGSISQRHGSADPDPTQNVMDPEHWFLEIEIFLGHVKWHRADKEVASSVVVRTGFGIEPAVEDLCGVAPGGASSPSGGSAAVGLFVLAANARVVVSAVSDASPRNQVFLLVWVW